ncbi:hypothetical protein IAD21_00062 [Abditibacteriota bacterium]|nr:hypothetical protein IAD21_00062 [Abditibacteriota bacterium]
MLEKSGAQGNHIRHLSGQSPDALTRPWCGASRGHGNIRKRVTGPSDQITQACL